MSYLLWHGLAAAARRHPERPAVSYRGTVLTYATLDQQSSQLAALLIAHGIGKGDRVGLLMPKSERAVVAMLGILKCGAAYVPVDPTSPAQRAGFILRDCAVRGLVTTGRKLRGVPTGEFGSLALVVLADDGDEAPPESVGTPVVRWSEALATPLTVVRSSGVLETDPAYLLYTSGSTGTPKGVILSHRHALTFVAWCVETFGITSDDRLSNHAPLHFDLSILDIFGALHAGACVVIVPDEIAPFPRELAQWIGREAITVWYSVPSALTRLVLHGSLRSVATPTLRTVLFAGEVFPVKYLREVMACWPQARFFNLYGPTETNVCTYYEVPTALAPEVTDIPIGRACANSEVFAVDESGRVVGPDDVGELYVRGPTLLLGYWNQPERTAATLVRNPLQSAYAELVYRTGDLVRLGADGNFWFIGRRDHMVKSRGYRIELGEIEQALYQHHGVREAAVVAIPDEEVGARLHAVIVANGRDATAESLQATCLTRLPRYMVPEGFHFRDELPRTSTGKVDRTKLAQQIGSTSNGGPAR